MDYSNEVQPAYTQAFQAWHDEKHHINKDAGEHAQDSIVNYGKLSCRQICHAVQARLPRELREMIYEHLFSTKTNSVFRFDRLHRLCCYRCYSTALSCKCIGGSKIYEHWLDVDFVGLDFLVDAFTHHYRSVNIYYNEVPDIARTLRRSHEGLGIHRADYINHVCVYLNCSTFYGLLNEGRMDLSKKIQVTLKNLFLFDRGTKISFDFTTGSFDMAGYTGRWPGPITQFVELAFPVFQRLADKGFRVTGCIYGKPFPPEVSFDVASWVAYVREQVKNDPRTDKEVISACKAYARAEDWYYGRLMFEGDEDD